jgi:hypothetical protein
MVCQLRQAKPITLPNASEPEPDLAIVQMFLSMRLWIDRQLSSTNSTHVGGHKSGFNLEELAALEDL